MVKVTEVTDHIIPHKGDEQLFWDADNWQPCCRWHHDVVKKKLERLYEAGEIEASALRLDSNFAMQITRGEPR